MLLLSVVATRAPICIATALRQGAKSVHQLEYNAAPPEVRAASNQWPEWPFVKKTDYGQR